MGISTSLTPHDHMGVEEWLDLSFPVLTWWLWSVQSAPVSETNLGLQKTKLLSFSTAY